MTRFQRLLYAIAIIATCWVVKYLAPWSAKQVDAGTLRLVMYYAWYLFPALLLIALTGPYKETLRRIGLTAGALRALKWGFLFTLPMLIGFAVMGQYSPDVTWLSVITAAVLPAFFEEWFFRGFVFGELFRRAKWGFLPAAGFNAALFGAAHLWQGNSPAESAGVFAITFLGAGWFAWLYVEWKNNLWVPITLHLLMNLYWHLFDIESNALGGLWANVFRGMTIALSVYFTIRLHKPPQIRRENLLRNPH